MSTTHIGPYHVEAELGTGGMGTVYRVREGDGPPLALKLLHEHLVSSEGVLERFRRELEVGSSVVHPNVVRTYGGGSDGNRHWIVMELVEGQTLADLRRELERLPEELCRHVGRAVSGGLAALHEVGAVHRDIKPENVLITPDHSVKLMDLGVARISDEALRLSRTGMFIGSVSYAAPEQFESTPVDARTDLYALGLVLYELSSGRNPFRGGSMGEIVSRVLKQRPRALGELNPQLTPFFEHVVHTLLEKRPEDRFQSARELEHVLRQGEESPWWTARSRALRKRTRRPLRRVRVPRETAVYGRDRELGVLDDLFRRASGGAGQVVLVQGEAGIGKSRLVDEFVGRLDRSGVDFGFLFGGYPPGGAASASGAFSTAYREHLGDDGAERLLTATPLLAPAFDALLRGGVAPPGAQELTPDSTASCFVQCTRALAEVRPVIVMIEDLHFAPPEALRLFTSLASAVQESPVLLIGTARPGTHADLPSELLRLRCFTRMELPRLGPKDLAALLAETFNSEELALGLAGQIGFKSDGNPFFAFEIVRGLREGQFITRNEDGTWVTTRVIDDIRIPSSVQDLVNARVADLDEEERNVLDVAACCGFEFDPLLVGDVLDIKQIPLMRSLARVEKKHRLVRASGRRFVFDHHQVQEALYSALPVLLREPYHHAIAEALQARATKRDGDVDGETAVLLCEHFLKGAAGEEALRYLQPAQDHLGAAGLLAKSIELAEAALAQPGLLTGRERVEVLLRVAGEGGPLATSARWDRQEELLRELEAQDLEDDVRVVVGAALGRLCVRRSRFDEGEAAYRAARELAQRSGDLRAEWRVVAGLCELHRAAGRLDRAEELARRTIEMSRELGDDERVNAGRLGNVLATRGDVEAAEPWLQAAVERAREHGTPGSEAVALSNLAIVVKNRGRLGEAEALLRDALAIFRDLGDRVGEARTLGNLGNVCKMQGRLNDARRLHERHLVLAREINHPFGESMALGNLGNVLRRMGLLSEAQELHERKLEMALELGDPRNEIIAVGNLANVLADRGLTEKALGLHRRQVALTRDVGVRASEALGLLNTGYALWELLRLEEAEASARASVELSRTLGRPDLLADAQSLLGRVLIDLGRSDEAAERLREAIAVAEENDDVAVVAIAGTELARLEPAHAPDAALALKTAGDTVEGRRRASALHALWLATGGREHLAEAHRLLGAELARLDDETAERVRGLRWARDVLDSWERNPPPPPPDDVATQFG